MGASPLAKTTPARTGPIGRVVRLLLAALLAVFALDLIDAGVTDYDRTEVLRFPGFWLLTVATIDTIIRFLPLPRRLRWLAAVGLAAVAMTAAAISVAATGSAWGPPLTRLVWSVHVALLVMASISSLIPAVALATPSCELTVWRDLRARARGTHPRAVQPCVAGLHLLDAWEARRRGSRSTTEETP